MTAWTISPAMADDLPEIARLANAAYRGESAKRGWTNESDLLAGQRTDSSTLADDLAGPGLRTILCLRQDGRGPILACVFLSRVETVPGQALCYLGLLTVDPTLQAQGMGRTLLAEAERLALGWGTRGIVMTVISVRGELIAWYERRGYRLTGETRPFPYGDHRFGEPCRDDLEFVMLEKALGSIAI